MRDITRSVLLRKSAPKPTKLFFGAKKFITALTVALSIAGIGLVSLASASTSLSWTGQGVTNGSLNTTQCDAQNDPNGLNGAYLLWVFTGGPNVTSATITITNNGSTTEGPTAMTQEGNGAFHYVSGFYPLNTVGATVSYDGTASNPQLVISHGCPGKASPTISTTPNPTTATIGDTLNDTATLTGGNSPTGNVTFKLYGPSDPSCTGTPAYTETDTTSPYATTTGFASNVVGTWHWTAHYAGDTNNNVADSACADEAVTVNKAQLGINTTAHSDTPDAALVGNLSLGQGAHDSATVTGGVSGFALPDVTFYFFGKGVTCTNGSTSGATQLNTLTPDGTTGIAHPSTSETNLAAGTYNFMAVVAGNTNYLGATSNCEPFTVNKATLGLTTDIHNANGIVSSVSAGDTVHDTATITGLVNGFTPTNNVAFTFFTGDNCDPATSHVAAGTAPISNGTAGPSSNEGPLNAGSYAFQASYDGTSDPNYNTVTSACEPLTVNKVTPNISTTPNPATGALGVVLNDTATVTGGFNPSGSVTFKLYSPSDPTCSGTPALTQTDTSSPYGTSPGFTSNATGTWRWTATYNGDTNNNSVTSGCQDELVTVTLPLWCSPGFWAEAINHNRAGVLAYLSLHHVNLNTLYTSINGAPLSKKATNKNPTITQVLLSPSTYGGPAFNSVADYIAAQLGWGGTQLTGENCPLDAHGNLTTTILTL